MKLIFSPSHYPFFNLALEEYLSNFTDKESEYLLFYRNEPSLVMGKNQNAWEEMNYNYLQSQNILLSRRISGGGTVYHDLNNLNFSYIKPLDTKLVANYDSLLLPIVEFLKTLGLQAAIGERSDIWLENAAGEKRKITGTAQYTNKHRYITHGTLLFDADLEKLQKAITIPTNVEVSSKSLKSVRSKVINIREVLEKNNAEEILNIEHFEEKLAHFILLYFNKSVHIHTLTQEEVNQVEELAKEKYKSFEWIWGRSPACEIHRKVNFKNEEHSIKIKLNRGAIIKEISTNDVFLNTELQKLVDKVYQQEELEKELLPIGFLEAELKDWF
ncbi:biotin/lipoate A/B protein ligase family protein [Bernardetia sp.]|uniref:lipoate--protein ligase family protein n=1 Tax=Bernardetia sp. TaxID=1937974 RepID=UPI0025C089EF|nr:lipoate--protein ligase [Bernardetia sp.]